MEKKIKFSDQPRRVKIIYAAVIGVLCVTAIVIGIVSTTSNNNNLMDDEPTVSLPNPDTEKEDTPAETPDDKPNEEQKPSKISFVSPIVGEITKGHSIDTPVFSDTLQEWRVHTGIDISAEDGAEVYAAADGTVSKVWNDPFLGKSVEITHEGGIVTVYSNLKTGELPVKEGDTVRSGALIGQVGDSSISELADETHLHFAVKVDGVSVNPLDYISEDSKKASLGITEV